MYTWNTKIQYVKGVGPAKAAEFKGMGIETVGDLLEYQPLHHIYPGVTLIKDLKEGYAIIKAKIERIDRLQIQSFHGSVVVEAILDDGTGNCKALWWNLVFIVQHLRPGMTVTFWGKFKAGQFHQPKFSTIIPDVSEITGGYYGVHTKIMKSTLKEVFNNCNLPDMTDGIPRLEAFCNLHFPESKDKHKEALKFLKFDELFLMQLALLKKRKLQTQFKSAPIFDIDNYHEKIKSFFSYKFTNSQWGAVSNILDDVSCTIPMNRLLHGDVGCGKTAVAFYAAMLTALNRKRALILCPTTILAQQHYDTLKGMGWGDVSLLNSVGTPFGFGWDATQTKSIVIGTHNLLNKPRLLASASLVIIDEFQKFGVEQRAKIQKYNPHLLLMSATPIPRTLAMSVFGDLDVSTIRELPIERGTVITKWVHPEKRNPMYDIIEGELRKDKQIYVVYPRIDSEDKDIESATNGFEEIKQHFPNYRVGFLTGKRSEVEKRLLLGSFKKGNCHILVSTIIAEVGLDNPNASVMVVEGADRFGLSQLHQLRGRICRSEDITFCFLVAETANDKSIARLEVMEKCNDGFEIAEQDLRLRGPGEIFSTRQHGLPNLKFASLIDDYDLLIKARTSAFECIDKLDEPNNADVKSMLEIKYGDTIRLGEVI